MRTILALAAALFIALTSTGCSDNGGSESGSGDGEDSALAATADGGLPDGDYTCRTYGGAGGNLSVTIDGGEYSTSSGSGEYSVDGSGEVEFISGPWVVWNGAVLSETTFGLTDEEPADFYSVTCELD
ncbi:hypothetical protein JGU71_18010 [Antrihabitans sp. YC3-6]|uniref:C-type lysozyme inhibitor domain-containing protein n=1 Tax=Antrihabitans stalagmiti TaxID=2799499 RepID=A0A934NTA7_9NOCA|nr:hypothetical protein [Antrihabitans stalagmiti]MBJ8340790.1 hypothetical protein [Antrihabitans stalagmiti]